MILNHAIRLLLLCGLLVLCVNEVYGKYSISSRKNKTNHNSVNHHRITQKLNYKNLSKHLHKRLDSSCWNTPPPEIRNGKLVRFKKIKFETRKSRSKHYMVAEFKCNHGYKFRNSHPKKMFCSKKKWVGKKPVCDKIKNNFDTLQGDDPNAASPQYFLNSADCLPEDQAKCPQICRMDNGQPQCDCLPGFQKDGNDCKDINECENPKINEVCKFGCVNIVGSYYCKESLDGMLADQSIDNETVPREDDDYESEDYADEDYEEEDYDEGDDEDENYDDTVEESEKDVNQQKESEQSFLGKNNENNSKKESDKSDEKVSRESSVKEEDKADLMTTTVAPITPTIDINKKSTESKSEDDNYENETYDEEYYDEDTGERLGNVTKINSENKTLVLDSTSENFTTTDTSTFSTTENVINKLDVDIKKKDEGNIEINSNTSIFILSKNDIDDRQDDYEEENEKESDKHEDENEKKSDKQGNVSVTEPPYTTNTTDNTTDNTTAIPETKISKRIDDSLDEEYDDYDDEDYDSNEKKESDPNIKTGDDKKENLPDVDIDKVNKDLHEIIKNNTQIYFTDEAIITTTSKSQEIPEVNEDEDEDDDDDEYEYEDYGEEDYKEKKKETHPIEKEITKCEKGYTLKDNGECADLDECQTGDNLCSDGCENTIGSYRCICPIGFIISSSDPHACQDINECLDNPCSHTCVNIPGSYYCECPSGLTLHNHTCVNLTCSHGQTKINGLVQCTCPSGFALGLDERTCEDVDECQLGHQCSDTCRNTIGSFECACNLGFELANETICVDIDECKSNHGCPQLCQNVPGSFKCSCEDGYEYNEKENICVDINECDDVLDLDECTHICVNYEGGYECACYSGYKLGSDDATCEDINECSANNGNCSQICSNQPGSYHCECEVGYILASDNETCEISDPCLLKNGGCSHECVNDNGTAVCKCPEGQILEGKDCFKVDPCVANKGGCSHECVNANGAVRCECPEGYELENKTNCVQINLCTINNGNCSHFCEFVDGHVNCLCPDMFLLHNKTQCVEIDLCKEDNGGCSHICSFENHAVICSCPSTHELRNDTHCFEKNPCLINNGGCSDLCNFSNGTLSCSCPENYYLEGKTCYRIDPCLKNNGGCSHECFSDDEGHIECFCPNNFELKDDNKTCSPKNPCSKNNGNCSHICNFSTGLRICSCPDGFKLKNKTHCEEFNPCFVENGGCSHTCQNLKGQATCVCPEGYTLPDSKNCVPVDPCQKNNGGCSHVCTNVNNKAQCSCLDHYNLENKTTCVPVDPCLINNGGCSHECVTESGEAFCVCPEGYKLHGRKCVAVNPCDTKNGGCSHVCTSINGQVICKCPPGHELIDKTCFKINPCSITNGGCSHGCVNVNGQAKCSCPPGYKLFGKKCSDEDPCTKNNGGCSHYCRNNEGRRECSCPPGYILRPNKRVCKEINECKVNRGGCSHGCKNLPGSYQCTCPQGFMLDSVNNKTCIDIDECQTNNGNCQMFCRNFKGGFKCECPEGHVIQKDKRTCKSRSSTTTCRTPKQPKNGVMRCSDQNSDLERPVPFGTKCNVWCNGGFRMEGSSQRICNSSGIWEGDEPLCVAASCPMLPDIRNGWYLPGVCNSGKVFLGESCKVFCRKGYRRNIKSHKYVCGEEMQWSPSVVSENLITACVKDVSKSYIKCPGNGVLEFVLPTGQRQMIVKIPKPESNVDFDRHITSHPSWGKRLETTLPAGRSEVRFTAMAPGDLNSSSVSCSLTINVLDKEQPRVMGCPENLERTLLRGEPMQIIHWREPTFFDNVGISTVYKSREPGSEFGLGLHHISYVASDEAGNRAFCHFTVDVKDEYDSEVANSIREHATFTNHNNAGRYRAVLICPSGVQYMSNSPDNYNNMLTSEAGCYWRHIRVTRPMQPQSFKIPRVYSESRLPPNARNNRRVFFKWSR